MSRSESSPTGRRALRWVAWLGAGVLLGALAGFAAGLGTSAPEPSASVGDLPASVGGDE